MQRYSKKLNRMVDIRSDRKEFYKALDFIDLVGSTEYTVKQAKELMNEMDYIQAYEFSKEDNRKGVIEWFNDTNK